MIEKIISFVGMIIVFIGGSIIYEGSVGSRDPFGNYNWGKVALFILLATPFFWIGDLILKGVKNRQQDQANIHAKAIFKFFDFKGKSIFLRPFDLDGKFIVENVSNIFSWEQFTRPGEDSLERTLADAVQKTAPLIALGERGGLVYGAGVAGTYDDWQVRIGKALQACEFIFVIPSANEGTLWEISAIVERGHLDKTVFIIPPSDGILRYTGTAVISELWQKAQDAVRERTELSLPAYASSGAIFRQIGQNSIRIEMSPFSSPRSLAIAINHLFDDNRWETLRDT